MTMPDNAPGPEKESAQQSGALQIGAARIEPRSRTIQMEGRVETVAPSSMAVLLCLVENAGATVSEDRLRQVAESEQPANSVVSDAIQELRRALGHTTQAPTFIETNPKGGYRLIAPVGPAHKPRGTRLVLALLAGLSLLLVLVSFLILS